jgi:UDP-GlcNAc:undecaprenyl-phosphate GlcNAc-1-phosphate transferase
VIYLIPFAVAFLTSMLLTPQIRKWALAHNIVAQPGERKIHTKPVAYLGGVAIFLGFLIPAIAFLPVSRRFVSLIVGITMLVVVGVIDDMKPVNPWFKLGWQILAACVVLAGGIGIQVITNPFGGVIDLTAGRFAIGAYHVTPIGNLLTVLWIVGLVNVVNFMDGLDGLAAGVSAISAFVLFCLAISGGVHQPQVAILAIITVGAALGFLPYNFFPAKIFMGDGGAYFLGTVLALLAIYSGGKLATAGLVLGFAIFDGVWAVIRRLLNKRSPFSPDRHHIHHLLLDAGLSQRAAVLVLYGVSASFGALALLGNAQVKAVGFVILLLTMIIGTVLLTKIAARRTT